MFDKIRFANIISNINSTYSTMTEFAKIANFDRTYISKYINQKLDNPPTPKILKKIADASKGVTTYDELMETCGYIDIYQNHLVKILNELCHIKFSLNSFDIFVKYAYGLYINNTDNRLLLKNLSQSELDSLDKFLQIIKNEYYYKKSNENNSSNIKLWISNILKEIKQNKNNIINCYDGDIIMIKDLKLSELTKDELEEVKKYIDYLISKRKNERK